MMQFGLYIYYKLLMFDLKKSIQSKYLKRLFSLKKLVESIKIIFKVGLVFLIAFYFLLSFVPELPRVLMYM